MRSNDDYILKLLSRHDLTFYIPPYQRNYEWTKENCDILYQDIEKTSDSGNTQHFFGTYIYHEESSTQNEPDKLILVDGQQRLTTTMLFLIAARDCLTDDTLKNIIDSTYLKNNNVSNEDEEYKIKLKQVEADWDAYKNLILNNPLSNDDKRSNVFKNYQFFKSKLEKLDDNQIESLVEKGIKNFNIVTIQLEPDRNPWEKPQEIFESMNSLGKPLSLADLVRNYLLLGKKADQQDYLYHNFWLRIEKNLSGDNNSFSVSSFIRDYMQLKDAKSYKKASETNYKELYRDFKNSVGDNNHESLIKELAEYSDEYAILADYKSSGNQEIDLKLSDLRTVESSGFYSFILGILHLRTEQKLDDNDVWSILDAIFIYITRRRILRITQGENKDIPQLVKYYGDLASVSDKKSKMLELLSNQQYALRLPNDNDIRNYLVSPESNFYNLRSGKFLLTLIEEKLTKNRPDIKDKYLQMEHIMPQTLNNAWKNELGENWKEIHDKYLNNIGNLTLIRHNQELSNHSFSEKKEIYENNAGMQIAKNKIINQQVWGEDQIINRAEYLIQILLDQILQLPENLKTSNNYSTENKRKGEWTLSFVDLGLVGETISYYDDPTITAEVIGDKELKFEDKEWKLSTITREIETRKNRRNPSGTYHGISFWKYEGKTLEELMIEKRDSEEDDEDFEEFNGEELD